MCKQCEVCQCTHCGRDFRPRLRKYNQFCSRECAFAFKAANRQSTEQKAAKVAARLYAEKLRTLFARLRQCEVCKTAFLKKGNQALCGSEQCRRAKHASARREGYRQAVGIVSGVCDTCGCQVEPARRRCEECRREIRKAHQKQARWNRNRKQAKATAKYQSRELLKLLRGLVRRAKGKCPLCGLVMHKRARELDPDHQRAQEFDHKLPLSLDGPDTISNLQAICRRCNGLKGAFTSPEIVIGKWMAGDSLKGHGGYVSSGGT